MGRRLGSRGDAIHIRLAALERQPPRESYNRFGSKANAGTARNDSVVRSLAFYGDDVTQHGLRTAEAQQRRLKVHAQ
jgi:hypothetical protein